MSLMAVVGAPGGVPARRRRCSYCGGAADVVIPCSKRCRIAYLLDRWEDIFSPPGVTATSASSSGLGVALLPLMSRHRSVVELERCLGLLGVEAPVQLAHLKAYRCAEWRIRVGQTRIRRPRRGGGKVRHELVESRVRERIVPAWVRLEKVRRAEERLAELFVGSAEIPEELWDAVTLSVDAIEAKERKRRLRGAA